MPNKGVSKGVFLFPCECSGPSELDFIYIKWLLVLAVKLNNQSYKQITFASD